MKKLEHKHICLVAGAIEVPSDRGYGAGGSTHVIEVAKGLVSAGLKVTIFCARGQRQSYYAELGPIKIYRVFCWNQSQGYDVTNRMSFLWHVYRIFTAIFKIPYRFIRSVAQARAIVRELRGVTVHSIYERSSSSTSAGPMAALWINIPLVAEVNDLDYGRLSLKLAKRIIVPNAKVLPHFVHRKCVVLPWGVDTRHFFPREGETILRKDLGIKGETVVLFAGSMLLWHGLSDLVKAATKVPQEYSNVIYLIIGDGPLRDHVQSSVEKMGLKKFFRFTGFVEYNVMPRYMALADIAVAPYTDELCGPRAEIASPLKVLEYMAMGLPTIVTSVGNRLNFVENGVHGLVIEPGAIDQLAHAIIFLVKNEDFRRNAGKEAALKCANHFSWDQHCSTIVNTCMQC